MLDGDVLQWFLLKMHAILSAPGGTLIESWLHLFLLLLMCQRRTLHANFILQYHLSRLLSVFPRHLS